MLLINKNEILRHTVNVVGNILVEHSKHHITSDDAIQEIRKVLRKCTSTLNM